MRLRTVLHLDAGRVWAGGQNQVRLLMRYLAPHLERQLCLCPRRSGLAARLRASGLPVREAHWRGGVDPRAMIAVARLVRRFELVHCHDAHSLQVALIPAKLARVPIVASRRLRFVTASLTWNRAARVIAISQTVAHELRTGGVGPERIRVVPDGVDAAEVAGLARLVPSLRERCGVRPDTFLIGNIAHLHAVKGQRAIPEALALVPDVHAVIVGEGEQRDRLESLARERGVAHRFHLAGALPDARRVLREFDLFVFPSTDEGLGSSILDAMAAGIPVVAADAAGAAEILRTVHTATGTTLFPPGDAGALAALVTRFARDPTLRRAMLEAQRARLADFAIERTGAATLAVYHEVA